MTTERKAPRLWIMLAAGLPLAVADIFLWALIGFQCSGFENLHGGRAQLCNHNHPQPRLLLPLIGAAIVLLSIYGARRFQRNSIFALGALVAAITGGYIFAVATI